MSGSLARANTGTASRLRGSAVGPQEATRSLVQNVARATRSVVGSALVPPSELRLVHSAAGTRWATPAQVVDRCEANSQAVWQTYFAVRRDRKSTRLNSS